MIRKILILAANPRKTSPLRLDQEMREIDEGLRRSRNREQFSLEKRLAVRTEDLRRSLLDEEPNFVHFCGHGTGDDGIVVEDVIGEPQLVKAEALASLFKLFSNQIDCVILNACYSEIQAQAISQHIKYVIGMKQAIGDRAAIQFATGFYDAIGAGRGIEDAFEFGKNAIELQGISEELTPVIKKSSALQEDNLRSERQADYRKLQSLPDNLIQEVKYKLRPHIQELYGVMRVLDMTQPIGLESIYTHVNILEKITGRQRLEITELLQDCDPDNFERVGLGNVREQRVPGLIAVENHSKLMILGKPGAGKTTFMKHLAIQCIWDKFQIGRVPIFITLKHFAETPKQPSLLQFINQIMAAWGVVPSQTAMLLKHGRALILFDGLDEVKESDNQRVLKQIQDFCNQFFFSKEFKSDQNACVKERFKKQRDIESSKKFVRKTQEEVDKKRKEIENLEQELNEVSGQISTLTRGIKTLEELQEPNSSQLQDLDLRKQKREELRRKSEEKRSPLNKIRQELENLENEIEEKSRIINEKESELSKEPDLSLEVDQGLNFLSKRNPDKFYINHFVITCRIAAQEFNFENFTEVEVADFDETQIAEFSKKWFTTKEDPIKAEKFVIKLQQNQPIQELANNPLLLTLLCLVFEDSADFPANRAELYSEGLDVLLKKWDAKRNIERSKFYKNLSLQRKEDLLSQIAFDTFERGEYFFKKNVLEQQIKGYIKNLPDSNSDPKILRLDCEAILKSIEAQHGLLIERAKGIYSFSHLTFHEYFAARKIVSSAWYENTENLDSPLKKLVKRITEKRWREVFFLTLGMLPNASYLVQLMKEQIDFLLERDGKLQEFLEWLYQKSVSVDQTEKSFLARAFYFENTLGFHSNNKLFDYKPAEVSSNPVEICLDYDLYSDLYCALNLNHENALELYSDRNRLLKHEYVLELNKDLKRELQALKDRLPFPGDNEASSEFKVFQRWWEKFGQDWILELRMLLEQYRNIGRDWNFGEEQLDKLKKYHTANELLLSCLSSDVYISRDVRKSVEETLLLPKSKLGRSTRKAQRKK